MLIGLTEDALDVITANVTVAVCVNEPLVPVIVSVGLPAGVLLVVVTVSVDDPVPLTVDGENDAVAPLGTPLLLRLTDPLNPLMAPTFTVYVVLLPAFTVCVLGVAETEKSGFDDPNGTI
jgi:hypothetical protein